MIGHKLENKDGTVFLIQSGFISVKQDGKTVLINITDLESIAAILKAERNEAAAAGRKRNAIANFGMQGALGL